LGSIGRFCVIRYSINLGLTVTHRPLRLTEEHHGYPAKGRHMGQVSCTGIAAGDRFPQRRRAGQAIRTAERAGLRASRPRTGGLPDGDGARGGLPVGRQRPIAAGSPLPRGRDRPAGRHHGSIQKGYPAVEGHRRPGYGRRGVRLPESRLRHPYCTQSRSIRTCGSSVSTSRRDPIPCSKRAALAAPQAAPNLAA